MSLSAAQVEAYLDRILLPQSSRVLLRQGPDGKDALKAVTALQQYHMAHVPFDNLDLHYSSHHSLPQELDIVYEHVVAKQRGGTCPQVHPLFAKLLEHFGFSVYLTGGRLNAASSLGAASHSDRTRVAYGPWGHVNTVMKLGSQSYLVDTNFNQNASPFPVPLVHDQPAVDMHPRQRRMLHTPIPGWRDDQLWWRLQLRDDADSPWMDVYCFTETEWLAVDFHVLISGLDRLGVGWFKSKVACYRVILEEDTPVGYLMIWQDELRRHYKGETQVLQKFYSESERVASLAEDFGLQLTDEEKASIMGTDAELKEDEFDFYGE